MIFDCGQDISQTYKIKSNDCNSDVAVVTKGPNNHRNNWINKKCNFWFSNNILKIK